MKNRFFFWMLVYQFCIFFEQSPWAFACDLGRVLWSWLTWSLASLVIPEVGEERTARGLELILQAWQDEAARPSPWLQEKFYAMAKEMVTP